jgi:RNA polymerase sigma factor (sigma-70 family)
VLFEAASRGERAAQERLLRAYDPFLRARAREHLGAVRFDRDGDDLLQTLRLALVLALPGLRGRDRASFAAWLRRLVRCRILDWEKARRGGRGSKARTARLETVTFDGLVASTPSPSHVLMNREASRILEDAIGRVPERYRAVLRLIRDRQPPVEQLAAILEKSPEGARKFVERAVAHLRRVLEGTRGAGP